MKVVDTLSPSSMDTTFNIAPPPKKTGASLLSLRAATTGVRPAAVLVTLVLRSCMVGRSGTKRRLKELVTLIARIVIHRAQTQRWLAFLHSTPLLTELLTAQPRLLRKIYWPYLTNALQCPQRLEALIAHYTFIAQHGLSPIAVRTKQASLLLGTFTGKTGIHYEIRLTNAALLETEGEWVLQLCTRGTTAYAVIYSVAFTVFMHRGSTAIAVGCLQGPCREIDGLTLIQQTTRELHGLRPKALMIRLLQQFGLIYGCTHLMLTANCNRVVQYAMSKGRVHADYDTLWQELGAEQQNSGDFLLRCELPVLNLEAIPSRKRSEAKKRAVVLDSALLALKKGFM